MIRMLAVLRTNALLNTLILCVAIANDHHLLFCDLRMLNSPFTPLFLYIFV